MEMKVYRGSEEREHFTYNNLMASETDSRAKTPTETKCWIVYKSR
jgi:hypothetical protein